MQGKDKLTGLSDQEDVQSTDRKEEIREGFELGEHGQKRRLASQARILIPSSPAYYTSEALPVGSSIE